MTTKTTSRNKKELAVEIVRKELRQCYLGQGVIASPVHFSNYWGRDTFWALRGMIHGDKKDLEMSRKSLELFMKYQRGDGKIPRKIVSDVNIFKRIGINVKRPYLLPVYASPIKYLHSLDENLLFVSAFCKYIEKTNDLDFARDKYHQLVLALDFFRQKRALRDNLLCEWGLGNWMDTILKRGFVLYTNCLWHEALKQLQNLSRVIERDFPPSLPTPQKVKLLIQRDFWNKDNGFFVDALSKKKRQKMFFDTAGNLLAVFFGIADADQAKEVLEKVSSLRSGQGLHPTNDPPYPPRKVNPLTYFVGIEKYHNGISWSWIEIIHILALLKSGDLETAQRQFDNLCEIISKNETLHETYNLDGTPFDKPLWKSTTPFAWSAGLFLYVLEKLEEVKSEQF